MSKVRAILPDPGPFFAEWNAAKCRMNGLF